MIRYFSLALVAASVALAAPTPVDAKDDKGRPEHAQGGDNRDKAKFDTPGKGPKFIPPGQIKRYTRGAKLPADLEWEEIGDLSRWKLRPPGKGNRYIRIDNEILEIARDTQIVIDAIGIVGDLLR